MSLFIVAVIGLCVILLIAFSVIAGNDLDPRIFHREFWSILASTTTALGSLATALAAFIALAVYRHQRHAEKTGNHEQTSKYYMDQCLSAIEKTVQQLIDTKAENETLISAGLILGEVTQLEQHITDPKHQRLYTLHRQCLIDQAESSLTSITLEQLIGLISWQLPNGIQEVSIDDYPDGIDVSLTHTYHEDLLDENGFETPFSGMPLGRLLCLVRFFLNDPHFVPPEEQLTRRELNELFHLRPIDPIKQYVLACASVEYCDRTRRIRPRKECLELLNINMNYDLVLGRTYIV